MSADYFLDTNVLVYSFDRASPKKQERAKALVSSALTRRTGIISWQVAQEFLNVARHKFAVPLNLEEATRYFDLVLAPLCRVQSEPSIYRRALALQLETQYRFHDALVLASAIHAQCSILYFEDLQEGRLFDKLKIINPFREV